MINRTLLLETEYTDFTDGNGRPLTDNVAEWIFLMYELEFKLNLINNHIDKFDPEDNITDVKLEEVKKVLEDSVRVIGLHLLSLIY
jgi:hypothetical protein